MNLDEKMKEYQTSAASATHLLLIAQTKAGKTDYVAQAAIDGWEILYLDNDNGLKTLGSILGGNPEALRRVHYFDPADFLGFLTDFVTTKVPLRYDSIAREFRNSTNITPGAIISEIYPFRIPRNVIVVIDSWTTLALAAITKRAFDLKIDLMEVDKYGREIYAGTGFKLTEIAKGIQGSPFDWIVQAHPAIYERKEKPANSTGKIEEKDMIIRETTQIPASTSGPHGFSIGKYFNEIGWLSVDQYGKRKLDFKVIKDRIGGGTADGIEDPRGKYRFSQLFGMPPVVPEGLPWLIEMTAEEYKAAAAAKFANAPKLSATGIKMPTPTGVKP